MKRKKLIIIGVILAVTAGIIIFLLTRTTPAAVPVTAKVTRGDLIDSITCTGTLVLKNACVVNFETSGTVNRVLADFNQTVRSGQRLATLDTTQIELSIKSASANCAIMSNQLLLSDKTLSDTKVLFDQGFKSQSDVDTAQINRNTAYQNLQNSLITLEKAVTDLRDASIYAPINGIVIERNVDVGQTVASAEYNTSRTTNFLLASDITHMLIYATVDENDIVHVKQGQKISFSVPGYAAKTFQGTVSQVRLEPVISDNVVNYTVVLEAENPERILIPGMTATVKIVIRQSTNVLLVPNAALKIQPPVSMLPERPANAPGGNSGHVSNSTNRNNSANVNSNKNTNRNWNADNTDRALLWTMDAKTGKLIPVPVKKGLDDGSYTEVISLPAGPRNAIPLSEGLEIVTGFSSGGTKNQQKQTSFLNSMGGRNGPMPGGPGPR